MDLATESLNEETLHYLDRVLFERREQALHALERLDAGRFGICEECLQPIEERRLRVLPFARFCVYCQERAEQGLPLTSDLLESA